MSQEVLSIINWKCESGLYPIHHDHCFETLDVIVFVEEPSGEVLVVLHIL